MTDAEILARPIASLTLTPSGPLASMIESVMGELRSRGIRLIPDFTLGDPDFWTLANTVSVNLPWFLADGQLWRLARQGAFPYYTPNAVLRLIRHEVGHAVFYAYGVAKMPAAQAAFGDFSAPYRDSYRAIKGSPDFVQNLHGIHVSLDDYAQKHPEEDWCETFARMSGGDGVHGSAVLANKLRTMTTTLQDFHGIIPARTTGGLPTWRNLPGTVGDGLRLEPLPRRR